METQMQMVDKLNIQETGLEKNEGTLTKNKTVLLNDSPTIETNKLDE
jgi:hypothetical protein